MQTFFIDFFVQRFGYDYLEAKNLNVIVPICMITMIPILSGIIIKVGKKGLFMLASSIIAVACFHTLESIPSKPSVIVTFCLIGIGLFNSISNICVISSLMLVVPEQAVSVAMGLFSTLCNVLMTTMPVLLGKINKPRNAEAYNRSIFLLKMMGVIALVSSVGVILVDFRTGKRIHLKENDKRVLEAK